MSIKLGTTAISTAYLGGTAISKAYLGSIEVYSSVPASTGKFETVLYTGNGSTQTVNTSDITGDVDFVWIKRRNAASTNYVYDSIRGHSYNLRTNAINAESNDANCMTGFGTASFDVGSNTEHNGSGGTFVAWCASLPTDTASNTDGSITSTTKNNEFMSVVSYTGNLTSGATVGHSLGKKPQLVIAKNREAVTEWEVYNETIGAANYLKLNSSSASGAFTGFWNDTEPSTSVITLGNNSQTNGNVGMIAYCFTSVADKCKVGSYTGTGSSGLTVDVGFEPAWVMIKRTDGGTGSWLIYDDQRGNDNYLLADTSGAEASTYDVDLTATGFTLNTTTSWLNNSSNTYIYLAIAKN